MSYNAIIRVSQKVLRFTVEDENHKSFWVYDVSRSVLVLSFTH